MRERTENKKAGVVTLATLGLIVVGLGSFEFLVEAAYRHPAAGYAVAAGCVVTALSFRVLAQRDFRAFLSYAILASAIVALISGLVVLFGSEWHPVAACLCVVTSGAALMCLTRLPSKRRDVRSIASH